MRLLRLTAKNDECWAHLPHLRRAIEAAGVAFRQHGAPAVADRVIANFVSESLAQQPPPDQSALLGSTAAWYLWDDAAGRLRGHLVAIQGEWDGESVVYVYQLWARHAPDTFKRLADEELDHYARARGCSRVLMYTRRPSRYWTRTHRMTLTRWMYEREVPR